MSTPRCGRRTRAGWRASTVLALFALAPTLGLAQTGVATAPAPPVTLAQALEAAWSRSTAAAEASVRSRQAAAERTVAQAPWAAPPAIEVGLTEDRPGAAPGRRETELGLSWPLWLPGQRSARAAQADADREAAAASETAARWRLAGTVRDGAAERLLLEAARAQAKNRSDELQALAEDVDRRVAAGDLPRADALAARAEWLAARAQATQALQALQAAQARWTALTGWEAAPDASSLGEALELPTEDSQLPDRHPALLEARSLAEQARRHALWVRRSGREAPELMLRTRQERGGAEPTSRGVGVALRLPLGTADRNLPLLAAAQGEVDAAEARVAVLQRELASELAMRRAALVGQQEQLRLLADSARLLRERAALVQRAFQAGEASLPDTLRAVASAADAEFQWTRQRAALVQARLQWQQARGELP